MKRDFFSRCPLEVAPELLGCRLVHTLDANTKLVARIVEVEAYLGDGSDPGSHSHRGVTRRNASMFGPPGRFYVYRSMGLHACANLVCRPVGIGAAVLLRAAEPVAGELQMRRNRGGRGRRELASGPGKLAQALQVELAHDGASALSGSLRVLAPEPDAPVRPILAGPRIGLSLGADLPYRFFLADSDCVTRSPQNRAARPYRWSRQRDG